MRLLVLRFLWMDDFLNLKFPSRRISRLRPRSLATHLDESRKMSVMNMCKVFKSSFCIFLNGIESDFGRKFISFRRIVLLIRLPLKTICPESLFFREMTDSYTCRSHSLIRFSTACGHSKITYVRHYFSVLKEK
jgi:hypothetical protein